MATFSINDTDLATIMSKFEISDIEALDPNEFVNFGLMNSSIYRTKFLKIADDANLSKTEITMVIVLFSAIKNKKRVLANISKFAASSWYKKVNLFIKNKMVQYTYEASEKTFAAVHVPASFPFIASRVWLRITANPTVDSFCENLWAAQINLDTALMDKCKAFETNFWAQTVKKGGNKFEDKGFNEDYFNTKSTDNYPLLAADGTTFAASDPAGYSETDIAAWIATK
jgi:hypothetical protein